ncbi:MAG: helix-turn-helix domain-containing protein, partial [Micromonospora sp.]
LAGDAEARRRLRHDVYATLVRAGGELLETLDAFFAAAGTLESAARALFVHPNTVRYRLKRIAEVTGFSPLAPRDAFALQVALTIGRLDPVVPGVTPVPTQTMSPAVRKTSQAGDDHRRFL